MGKTIGVVHGGVGFERDKSLQYGKQISKILNNLGMDVLEMHLHPNGSWTVDGQVKNIEECLKKVDKVWNCLVGSDGESGIVEELCEKCKVKMMGHSKLHSHISSNKKNLHYLLAQHKIKHPFGKVLKCNEYSFEKLQEIFSTVPFPAMVKPNHGSGLNGLKVVHTFSELKESVEELISQNQDVLIEKLIKGIPVSCFIFEHNNLLHTHIKVYDDEGKIGRDDIMHIRNEALYIHNVLAMNHHAEYDFILSPNKKGGSTLYFLEVNSHPALTGGYISQVFKDGVVPLRDYVHAKVVVA